MVKAKATHKTANDKAAAPRPTLGFGVPATSDPHHFKVIIPRNNSGKAADARPTPDPEHLARFRKALTALTEVAAANAGSVRNECSA